MARLKLPQAIPFMQNSRRCWVTKLTVKEAISLTLPAQGQQTSMFEVTNRGIDEPHANSIARYLETPHWALPALILAASPGTLRNSPEGSMDCDAAGLRVLDGQHRIKGMTEQALKGGKKLLEQELATVIIEVNGSQDQGQSGWTSARTNP